MVAIAARQTNQAAWRHMPRHTRAGKHIQCEVFEPFVQAQANGYERILKDVPERDMLELGAEVANRMRGGDGELMRCVFAWLIAHDDAENLDHIKQTALVYRATEAATRVLETSNAAPLAEAAL